MAVNNSVNLNGTGLATSDGDGTFTYSTTTDERVLRGSTANDLQDTGVTITDADVCSGITQLNVDNLRLDLNTLSSTSAGLAISSSSGNITASAGGTGFFTVTGNGGGAVTVNVTDTSNSNGAIIQLAGNGGVTPNKRLRAKDGNFEITSNAGDVILTLSNAGVLDTITQLNVDNLRLDGNTVSSTNTDGAVNIDPNGDGTIELNFSRTAGVYGLGITDTGHGSGAAIKFTGDGATTPSKYIKVRTGAFQIINSANDATIFNLSDAGVCSNITQLNVDDLRLDGTTLSNTAGGTLTIASGVANGNIDLVPAGTGQVKVTASGSGNALRIINSGSGNSLLVEDSASTDATPFAITSSGTVNIGSATPPTGFSTAGVSVIGRDVGKDMSISRVTNNSSAPVLFFQKARGTFATRTIVSNNDDIGQLNFRGFDGTNTIIAARIDAEVDGTPGTNDMPGRLVFSTTADGASAVTEAMRIDNAQVITLANDLGVTEGGTGRSTGTTAYGVLCAGTTATGVQQTTASAGSSGQVLTSTGASSLPSWQANSANGAWQFISSATASTSATLDFTSSIDSTYTQYMFVYDNLRPDTDQVALRALTSTDGGSTWDAGASDYSYNLIYSSGSAGVGAAAFMIIATNGGGANDIGFLVSEGLNGQSTLYTPSGTTSNKRMLNLCTWNNANGDCTGSYGHSSRDAVADVDAIQFYMSSGNITSGVIRMYGLSPS